MLVRVLTFNHVEYCRMFTALADLVGPKKNQQHYPNERLIEEREIRVYV